MKIKLLKTRVPGTHTLDGVTSPVTRTVVTSVPALPRDWQQVAMHTAIGTVMVLTLVSIGWSTWSIGSLLGGGWAYAVAVIFDFGWVVALILSYLSRYDKDKRTFPEALGWVLLVAAMGAIFWHGMELDSVSMAVVGAAVSFFAKILWIGVMKHVNAELSEDDAQNLAYQTSAAQTKAAIAQVRRSTARIETRAAMEMLAMERDLRSAEEAFGPTRETAEQITTEATQSRTLALPAPTLADLGKADAIRFAKSQVPELEPYEIVDLLADEGVEVSASYVKQTLDRSTNKAELVETDAQVITLRK